jgi:hypothetical protein
MTLPSSLKPMIRRLGLTPKALGSGFLVQDAFIEWKANNALRLDAGLMLVPFSRNVLQSTLSFYTLDISAISIVNKARQPWHRQSHVRSVGSAARPGENGARLAGRKLLSMAGNSRSDQAHMGTHVVAKSGTIRQLRRRHSNRGCRLGVELPLRVEQATHARQQFLCGERI